jgi:hypothetical protein
MERIGALETVCRYPVKSMAGEALGEAFVGFAGVMGDRVPVHRFVYGRSPPYKEFLASTAWSVRTACVYSAFARPRGRWP